MNDSSRPQSDPAQVDEAAELERARALLAAIVESSEDGIVSKTLEGIVTSWNAGAERLFGFTAEEMIGQHITKIIPKELHPEEDRILAHLRAGKRLERFETERLHKDGRRLRISLTVSPVLDASGKVIGAAKVAHDVTALRDREAQLRQLVASREELLDSERAARAHAEHLSHVKDEFLATLSHELRTPLNAIHGWTSILRHEHSTDEDFERGMEAIERNVRAQIQIVNDLLDMSRIISGKVHLDVRPLELHEIIESAIAAIKPSVDGKRIRVETSLDTRVGIVRGDQSRMQQVLWNLLSNAVKFTPSGGRISVGLRRVGSQAEIIIADTGIGISSEFLPYVFDRFRQGDPGTARKFGGLGLGLSIVRSLVELHGGTVRVESPGENQGSTFTVSLPIYRIPTGALAEPLDAPNRSATRAVTELPRLDGLRLLLVDDDLDGCTLVARILEGQGATVRATADPREGLEILRSERVDILLSDLGMPGMDGYEFITLVRKLERPGLGPIPAIAITAYARQEDRQRALLSGFQVHIAKPIEARELVAAIASLRPFLPR